MFLGAASLIGQPHVSVIYRELHGPCYYLANHNGYLETLSLNIPPQVTDRIPLDTLLRTLWWDEGREIELSPPQPLDITQITQALIEHRGDWLNAFKACGVPLNAGDKGGFLFERYVAGALLALGLPPQNVACNVKKRTHAGQYLHEIDIVVNHRSRIYVLDCKLRIPKSETEQTGKKRNPESMQQIRNLSDTVRQLGGVGAVGVLLRPNLTISGDIRAYAEDIGLRILDWHSLGRFFKELARILEIRSAPPELLEVQRMWQNPLYARRVFPPNRRPDWMIQSVLSSTKSNDQSAVSIVDLENLLREQSKILGQNWIICRLWGNYYYLRYDQREGQSDIHQIAERIQQNMRCVSSHEPWTSETGNTGYWQFQASPEDVKQFFGQYVGWNL